MNIFCSYPHLIAFLTEAGAADEGAPPPCADAWAALSARAAPTRALGPHSHVQAAGRLPKHLNVELEGLLLLGAASLVQDDFRDEVDLLVHTQAVAVDLGRISSWGGHGKDRR